MKKKYKLIIIGIVVISFFLGALFYQKGFFPFKRGYFSKTINLFNNQSGNSHDLCEMQSRVKRTFDFYTNLKDLNNIIIGDSVVEGIFSKEIIPNLNYEIIGINGIRLECHTYFHKSLKKIKPKNIIIYLGGNDADDRLYSSKVAISFYNEMIDELLKIETIENIYLLELHLSRSDVRDIDYVTDLNEGIKKLSSRNTKVTFIKKLDIFDFSDKTKIKNCKKYTYDCEHINIKGYVEWFKYLQKNIPGLIRAN